MDLRQAIQEIANKRGELYSKVCAVDSVNEGNRTCAVTPLDGGVAVYGVRLQAVQGSEKGFVALPKVGSNVVVTFINDAAAYVALCGEVDGYIMETGNENLKAIISDLIDAINAITVPTGVGPSGLPINAAAFTAIKTRLDNLLR